MSFIIKRGWGEGSQKSMSFKESVKIDYTGIPQQWGGDPIQKSSWGELDNFWKDTKGYLRHLVPLS